MHIFIPVYGDEYSNNKSTDNATHVSLTLHFHVIIYCHITYVYIYNLYAGILYMSALTYNKIFLL